MIFPVTDGRVLGHEGVGTVIEVGGAVGSIAVGESRDHLVHQLVRLVLLLPSAAAVPLPGR
jgi:hypothetical protein